MTEPSELLATKRCCRCQTERSREEFTRDKNTPDGLDRRCKACKALINAAYAVANRDQVNSKSRRYYAAHPEVRVKAAERREQNPERSREIKRAFRERNPEAGRDYYQANRDEILARQKADRAARPEVHAERTRKWAQDNPLAVRELQHRRRARLRAATVGPVDLEALWVANKGCCQLCGLPIDRTLKAPHPMSASVDHIFPLARGGTHEQSNLQWTHLVENIQKGATVPDSAPF